MTGTRISEPLARMMLEIAIAEGRSSELLHTLFDGGSVTISTTGELIMIPGSAIADFMAENFGDSDE